MFRYSFTFTYHIVYYRSFLWQHINNTIFRSFPSPKQRSNFSRNRRIKDAALIFRQISFRFANSRVNDIPGVKSKRWIEATREWNFNQLTLRVDTSTRYESRWVDVLPIIEISSERIWKKGSVRIDIRLEYRIFTKFNRRNGISFEYEINVSSWS